jgi:hypothetical protein
MRLAVNLLGIKLTSLMLYGIGSRQKTVGTVERLFPSLLRPANSPDSAPLLVLANVDTVILPGEERLSLFSLPSISILGHITPRTLRVVISDDHLEPASDS